MPVDLSEKAEKKLAPAIREKLKGDGVSKDTLFDEVFQRGLTLNISGNNLSAISAALKVESGMEVRQGLGHRLVKIKRAGKGATVGDFLDILEEGWLLGVPSVHIQPSSRQSEGDDFSAERSR